MMKLGQLGRGRQPVEHDHDLRKYELALQGLQVLVADSRKGPDMIPSRDRSLLGQCRRRAPPAAGRR